MEIKEILKLAQGLPNEFLANETRKYAERFMHYRSAESLQDLVTSCMVICAKHKAGDTKESLEKAVKEYDLAIRGKNLLTTYEN